MLGDRLKELREKSGLSQAEVAQMLNVQPATISRYEKDKNEPDNKTLIWYADYFDCTTDYLLGRVDNPHYIKKELPPVNGEKISVVIDSKHQGAQNSEELEKTIERTVLRILAERNQD